jgi:hypothetical protein
MGATTGLVEPHATACLEASRAICHLAIRVAESPDQDLTSPFLIWACWVAGRVLFGKRACVRACFRLSPLLSPLARSLHSPCVPLVENAAGTRVRAADPVPTCDEGGLVHSRCGFGPLRPHRFPPDICFPRRIRSSPRASSKKTPSLYHRQRKPDTGLASLRSSVRSPRYAAHGIFRRQSEWHRDATGVEHRRNGRWRL